MIVVFHTNIDAKYACWYFPKEVCCKPKVGDYVKPTNDDQTLKVCAVTHCYGRTLGMDKEVPYLEVELTGKPRY